MSRYTLLTDLECNLCKKGILFLNKKGWLECSICGKIHTDNTSKEMLEKKART